MGNAGPLSDPILRLPVPPSANRLWRSGRRRVFRSPEYVAWLVEAGWRSKAQCPANGLRGGAVARAGRFGLLPEPAARLLAWLRQAA